MSWDAATLKELKRLADLGLTGSQIRHRLPGDHSRSAITSKCRRMGFPLHGPPNVLNAWSADDDQALILAVAAGFDMERILDEAGRSVQSVEARCRRLNIAIPKRVGGGCKLVLGQRVDTPPTPKCDDADYVARVLASGRFMSLPLTRRTAVVANMNGGFLGVAA